MTTAQMIKDALARALAAVRLPFRAVLGGLNGKPGVQLAQGDALNGERLEAAERLQPVRRENHLEKRKDH